MTTESATRLAPCLSPRGRLSLESAPDAPPLDPALADRLRRAFERGSGQGLLQLGAGEVGHSLPPALGYWRELAGRFVTALCTRPDGDAATPFPPDLDDLAAAAPVMLGAEYVTAEALRGLWAGLADALEVELRESQASLQEFLKRYSPAWNLVGRVHFNLAENRKDDEAPFAFLATYSHRLSGQGKAQHLPLGQALREYAGAANKQSLLSLLLPVQRAAERCAWLREMVDNGEIFHPLRWTPHEAFRLLTDVVELERAGVVVRMPATWRAGRPSRPQVTGTVGGRAPSVLGTDALLDFRVDLTLDGEPLDQAEVARLLAGTDGLALVRGRWIEVDRERLRGVMARLTEARRLAAAGGVSFGEAMRMLAGADVGGDRGPASADVEWSRTVAGPWLAETLRGLRAPEALAALDPGCDLHGELRPYQQAGLRWLHLLCRLGLGACLADDMGLGKTIQVLALLLVLRRGAAAGRRPSLLVAPASLLANWVAELERFAPSLRYLVAHSSAMPREELETLPPSRLHGVDLVITTYGSVARFPWLAANPWSVVVVDEAQAIKNPGAKQTRAVKALKAGARIALTGTPVENHLGDLWSIFDFINPGLLGSARAFTAYTKRLADEPHGAWAPLRELVRPYILRRLKTDRSVIDDLPDKTEMKTFCQLARRQAALYQQAVHELETRLREVDGMKRRGLVLAFLVRLKQICNHPSQWLGDGAWAEPDSGKWARLRELCEVIASKQEKVLVFTQFREVTDPLATFLGEVFGRPGLVLHGDTAVAKRKGLVERFQQDEAVPFFILSLKAGGSGLNLTAASHVIHFDRWWNPAVEDQATDRAFRIGQRKNVLVHKLVCRGTVEERIDALIESKKQLSRLLLEGGAELQLTELADDELLRLVALDLDAAMKE